jgi:2-C-methyl-D-erythritol 4-phosphate cytidylyltransferase
MKYATAIVLAAGRGLRLKSRIPKPLIAIGSKPVIAHCLIALSRHPEIQEIVVVANPKNSEAITGQIKKLGIAKVGAVVLGGRLRQDSVAKGLKALSPDTDIVLVHDGVRPFIDKDTVSRLIKQAGIYGAAIPAVPVKATVKKVKRQKAKGNTRFVVEETLDRGCLWEVQTPQAFRKGLILKAYEKSAGLEVTDDSMLVERLGRTVCIVPGSYRNIKITTPEDLVIAEAIATKLKV